MPNGRALWWWEGGVAMSGRRHAIIATLVVVLGLLASWLLIGDLGRSTLGLVDENDVPQYIGVRGYISFSDIPRLLVEKTEIGNYGQLQRFRPIVYLDRLTETAIWGLDGNYWYRWRIVVFAIVIATLLWLYSQFAGFVLGTIITTYTLSFEMWVDIWTRSTAVNEQDASLGLALFALGAWFFVERWRNRTSLFLPSVSMAVGAIIAMGSKENMLLLEVPLCVVFLAGVLCRRIGWASAAAFFAAIVFGAWVASSIIVFFLGAKVQDIYGNSLQVSVLRSKWLLLIYKGAAVTAIAALTIDFLLRRFIEKEQLERWRSLAWRNGFCASIIVAAFVFNFLFYTGHIPCGCRYDFPAVLALPALLILLLKGVGETADFLGFGVVARKVTGLGLAIFLLAHIAKAPWTLPAASKEAVARNSAFGLGLEEAQRLTRGHPQWPIFVESFTYEDAEPVQALAFFFIAKSIDNPRYLVYVANPYGEPRTEFQSALDQFLISESAKGMTERGYSPLADAAMSDTHNCFRVVFRKPAQFVIDQANGKDPIATKQCVEIPPFMYWEDHYLYFDPPNR